MISIFLAKLNIFPKRISIKKRRYYKLIFELSYLLLLRIYIYIYIFMDSILVIAAHPDDEILGCGGTIARHSEIGDLINVVIVSTGITSRSNDISTEMHKEELEALRLSAEKANQIIGVQRLDFLNYGDNRLDSIDRLDLIKDLEKK